MSEYAYANCDQNAQIGDLLAQISGDGSTPTSAAAVKRPSESVKRKAEGDLRDITKTPRNYDSVSKVTQIFRPADRTITKQQSTANVGSKTAISDQSRATYAGSAAKIQKPLRPPPSTANGSSAAKAPPKKGSFAEILARGQRAQAVMGNVGKIQHKKVEKNTSLKREEDRAGMSGGGRKVPVKKTSAGYTGSAKPSQRNGTNGHGPQNGGRHGSGSGFASGNRLGSSAVRPGSGKSTGKQGAEDEQQKKIKKAAQATTGYSGTARPKPGNPVRHDSSSRGGALLNRPAPRPSRSSHYENDYDEDMDDFIEYDDDEDVGGPRYGYDSDGSSDMEAGMDDIDNEEQRADRLARQEDIQQERLERNLKMAKEERKRKALEALRAGRKY